MNMKKRNYKGLFFSVLTAATLTLGTGSLGVYAVEDSQTENSSETNQNKNSDTSSSQQSKNKNTNKNTTNSSQEDSTSKDSTASKDKSTSSKDTSDASQDSSASKNNQAQNKNNTKNNTNSTKNSTSKSSDSVDDEVEISDTTSVTDTKINLNDATTNLLIEKAGTYTLTGTTDQSVVVDTTGDVTLVLDNAKFTTSDLPAIYVRNADATKIEVKKTSTIERTGKNDILNAAVYVRSPLSLTGSGTLNVTDKSGHGMKSKGDMTSQNVTLNITSGEDGIHASDSLDIQSGKYTITSGDDGIQTNENLTIQNGTFEITSEGDSLHGDGDVTLSNGTYTLTANSEGIESKANLLIKNGTYTINATDDGLNAATSLTIQDGKMTVTSAQNDAIDSNGPLTLEGGTIYATGLRTPEGAFDVDNTPFVIKGGTVVGLSASATKPTDATQNTIMINANQSFSKLEVKQDGKTVLTYTNDAKTNFNQATLTLSSKDIQADKETEVYLDGELLDSAFTTQKGLTTVGNIATMGGGRGGMMGGMNRPDFNNGNNGIEDDSDPYAPKNRNRQGGCVCPGDDGYYHYGSGRHYDDSFGGYDEDIYFGYDGDESYDEYYDEYEEYFFGRNKNFGQGNRNYGSNGSGEEDGVTSPSLDLPQSNSNQNNKSKNTQRSQNATSDDKASTNVQ